MPNTRTLTVEAILVQVLLELVGRETNVLIHPKVGQAFCWRLGVCVLHPFWIDEGLVYPRSFTSLLFSAVFTLGPPPSTKSVALQFRSAGLTERANKHIHAQGFIPAKGSRLVDTPLTHASKFHHGGTWFGGGEGGVRGGAMER